MTHEGTAGTKKNGESRLLSSPPPLGRIVTVIKSLISAAVAAIAQRNHVRPPPCGCELTSCDIPPPREKVDVSERKRKGGGYRVTQWLTSDGAGGSGVA
jgi:hypothetical protein